MTDGQLLLLVFTLFYLYECLRWVPGRAQIWTQQGGKKGSERWAGSSPLKLLRTRGGAFALLPPVPPLGAHLVTSSWPCAPHEAGLCVWHDESGAATHIPWDQVQPSADESTLILSPHHRVRCVHGWQAAEWTRLVQSWKDLPQAERDAGFQAKAREFLDAKTLSESARAAVDETRSLRWRGGIIFVWTFGVLPYAYWRFSDSLPTLVAILSLYLLMAWQSLSLARIVRRDPRLRLGKWSHILGAAFFPPTAIRVADWVCSVKTPEVHPLLAAFVLGDKDTAPPQATQVWRLARWPVGQFPHRPWDGPEVTALGTFLQGQGLSLESLAPAPATLTQGAEQFCPRCLATFSGKAETCGDCGEMPLVPIASPAVAA